MACISVVSSTVRPPPLPPQWGKTLLLPYLLSPNLEPRNIYGRLCEHELNVVENVIRF